jgi:predicted NAD/FAD-binding protein
MKIAIIGSGIAGNTLAWNLHKQHDITLYEANSHIGGHTHTHDINYQGEQYTIDSGFIVFNYKTYPNFIHMLDSLDVPVKKSNMSFSVKCELSGLEYNGNNLNSLFAQRRNLFKPKFHRMIRDILRFNKESINWLNSNSDSTLSLGEYLTINDYSKPFIENYIIPMGSAIWSSSYNQMMQFPAQFFIRFFSNHGLLNVVDRPDWYVIEGGSRAYVEKLTSKFRDKIRRNSPVKQVKRTPSHVSVYSETGGEETYDYVFFACHSDQALRLLQQPSDFEQKILGAFPYQKNDVLLHTDCSLLPRRKLAWAAWNYHRTDRSESPVAVTYNMNILQGINSPHTFCVTLNNSTVVNEDKILKHLSYDHPVFTPEGLAAQQQHSNLNGLNRSFYAGAYWGNGFHEDGVVSALQALNDFQEALRDTQQALRRAG